MSISLAAGSPAPALPPQPLTVQPAPVVPPAPADTPLPPWVTATLLAWLAAAIATAAALRVFRRRSIAGPARLAPRQSAFSLLLIFFVGCGAMFIALLFARFANVKTFTAMLLFSSLAELLGVATMLALLHATGSARRLGVAASQLPRGLLVGVGAMAVLFPIVAATSQLTIALLHWAGQPLPPPHPVLEALGGSHDKFAMAVDVITAVIFAPLAEEMAFRGVLQTVLSRMFATMLMGRSVDSPRDTVLARWLAVLVTAGCFAAVHGVAAFVPPLFALAIGLGYVYERTGNLWCTVAMHALFNGFEIALFLSPLGR
jgi:membrane protease YdiL (CAAX protease family)